MHLALLRAPFQPLTGPRALRSLLASSYLMIVENIRLQRNLDVLKKQAESSGRGMLELLSQQQAKAPTPLADSQLEQVQDEELREELRKRDGMLRDAASDRAVLARQVETLQAELKQAREDAEAMREQLEDYDSGEQLGSKKKNE